MRVLVLCVCVCGWENSPHLERREGGDDFVLLLQTTSRFSGDALVITGCLSGGKACPLPSHHLRRPFSRLLPLLASSCPPIPSSA